MKKMDIFETELEEILNQDSKLLISAQKTTFENLTSETGTRYILFGAGQLGKETLRGLRKADIEPLSFVDNNPKLWDSTVEGLQVLSLQSAADRFGASVVFIITVFNSFPVSEQLNRMGLKTASFAALAWQYPQTLLPYWAVEYPKKIYEQAEDVRKAFTMWADETSQREFLGLLKWFTTLDPNVLPPHMPQKDIYFTDELISPRADEILIDCGAFNGDSIGDFLERRNGNFGQIIAIEPDPINCKALHARVASLPSGMQDRITIIQKATGSTHEMVNFNVTGTVGSSIGDGSYIVNCDPLDDILVDIAPTFIKMDIEGAELDALIGARQVITAHTPTLAVCLYHAQEHLWQIPLLIQSFSDQYSFHLRRYADECWETVCYAVPKKR
jgi:FkbM family methyltransferase